MKTIPASMDFVMAAEISAELLGAVKEMLRNDAVPKEYTELLGEYVCSFDQITRIGA